MKLPRSLANAGIPLLPSIVAFNEENFATLRKVPIYALNFVLVYPQYAQHLPEHFRLPASSCAEISLNRSERPVRKTRKTPHSCFVFTGGTANKPTASTA